MKTLFTALFGSKRTEAVRRAEPVINVGLDVGTASTKIVVQDVIDRKAKPIALRLGEAVAGYCPAATPSTIAVVDGKLTFGALAERARPSALILRSLKVCTACQYNGLTCRGCPYRAADCLAGRGGIFSIPTPSGLVRVTAQDMLTLYVAWARREVLRLLEELFPGFKPSRTLWNVAVPLGQVDSFATNVAYNILLGAAVELDGLIEQEVDLETALSRLRDVKRDVIRAPSDAERTFFLVPETLAAIQGYIHLPATKLGLYGIVDVGAGTTDVSFFDLYDKADRKLAFYAADAKAVGGDDFDLAAASALLDGHLTQPLDRARLGSLASLVRSARANGRAKISVDGRSFDLHAREVIRAEEVIAGRVWHAAHDVFETAYVQKLKSTGYWHHLPVLLVGGGSLNQRVDLAFARLLCPYTASQPVSHLQASKVIAPGPGLTSRDVQASLQFLLVAYGLSHPRVEFPDFERPSEVPNYQRPPEAERFDANDLYAK